MAGLDGLTALAQNVTIVTAAGDIAYRVSGLGPVRRVSGLTPQPATLGEWAGLEPPASRRRLVYPAGDAPTRYLATANERIWIDALGEHWHDDDRKERITAVLASRDDFTRVDMETLHLDTYGRFRKELLAWLAERSGAASGPAATLVARWRQWDGTPRGDPRAFSESDLAREILTNVLVGRVRARFLGSDADVPYENSLKRAFLLNVLGAPGDAGVAPFGLEAQAVARYVIEQVLAIDGSLVLHPDDNVWDGKHPFVGRVPVIGTLFAVGSPRQWGARDLVDAESPHWGPSMRVVWDLRRPWESTWIFPVGASGHVRSTHYADMQPQWVANQRLPVFQDGFDWGFGSRRAAP
jgi:acyl-homoserine lactone acylase PvdQ